MLDPLARVSVRVKLAMLFVSLCLLAYGLGGSLVSIWTESAMEEEILARLDSQCRVHATLLGSSLRLLERRLEDFASDGYIRDHATRLQGAPPDAAALRDELRRHLEQNKLPLVEAFGNLSVTGAHGALLVTVHEDERRRLELPAPDEVPDTTWAGGLLAGSRERPALRITTPVRHLDGTRDVGHLHVLVEVDAWVREAVSARAAGVLPPDLDAELRLHDGAGNVLAATPGAGLRLSVLPEGVRTSTGPVRGPGATPEFAPVRGTYARSFPVSSSGWWVQVSLGVERALLPVSGLKSRLLGVGVVLAVVSGLLLFFPMRFVVRPLMVMTRAAERLREGDLDSSVPVESEDEIGALARTFNDMAGAIRERTRRLEHTAADLRERQAELRAERDRVEAVIASMHDGLIVLDARGRPVLSNSAAQPLLDLVERGLAATGHHLCTDAGDGLADAPGHDCFACLMDTARPPRSCTIDVGARTFEVHTTPLAPDGAGGRGRVLVAREVTDRIRQDEREIHNERLAVLGEVAAVVAHEINNPLASISMFNQMLAAELPADSALRENTEVIGRNIETAKHAVRELLDYATGATPEVGPLDVHDVLADVVRFLHPISERAGVQVRLRPCDGPAWVTGDEIQLRQVFVNLTLNAVQAVAGRSVAPGRGPVVAAREGADGERRVTLSTRREGDRLLVDVSDTGPGIDADEPERIFRPFYTTKSRGEGTGLGLPTARRIAEMHGGGVEVVETSSRGTTFRVTLRGRTVAQTAAGMTGADA